MKRRKKSGLIKVFRAILDFPEKVSNQFKNTKFFNALASSSTKEQIKSKFALSIERFFIGINKKISSFINKSIIYKSLKFVLKTLFTCKLSIYGVFLISYAIVCAFSTALKTPTIYENYDMFSFYVSIAILVISIPFLISKHTFASFVLRTKLGNRISNAFGVVVNEETAEIKSGKAYIAIGLAVVLGGLSFLKNPLFIFAVFVQVIIALIILKEPEIGIIASAFLLVLTDLPNVVTIVVLTVISYLFKFIRGKRVFKLTKVDAFVLLFMFLTFLNIVANHQVVSVDLVFKYLLLIFVYYIVSVNTTRFLINVVDASIGFATLLMSLYVILGKIQTLIIDEIIKVNSNVYNVVAKTSLFFENYDSFVIVITLLFPLVFAKLVSPNKSAKKTISDFVSMFIALIAIFTQWNLLNWYMVIVSVLVIITFINRKMIYALIIGGVGLPLIYSQFEGKIVDFVSTNFSYFYQIVEKTPNTNVIHNTFNILRDYWFVGIGFDESVWKYIYSMYSDHLSYIPNSSNNLYLQIFVMYGLVGIILFAVILFYILYYVASYLCNYSKFKNNLYVYMDEKNIDVKNIDLRSHYINRQINVMAPFIVLCIYIVFGFSNYMWWNFKYVALFWLVVGLIVANCKSGIYQIKSIERVEQTESTSEFESSIDLKYRTSRYRR